jgi:hypothetical protein
MMPGPLHRDRARIVFDCRMADDSAMMPSTIHYAQPCRCSHDAVIRVYDAAGNVVKTHEHKGVFKES